MRPFANFTKIYGIDSTILRIAKLFPTCREAPLSLNLSRPDSDWSVRSQQGGYFPISCWILGLCWKTLPEVVFIIVRGLFTILVDAPVRPMSIPAMPIQILTFTISFEVTQFSHLRRLMLVRARSNVCNGSLLQYPSTADLVNPRCSQSLLLYWLWDFSGSYFLQLIWFLHTPMLPVPL